MARVYIFFLYDIYVPLFNYYPITYFFLNFIKGRKGNRGGGERRSFAKYENIHMVCLLDLTADFGVKTNAEKG